ncbi:uncharacterized protein LOC131873564, partial [Cryptomeria japonica]|uniref:uncharacterized protein LOC131873544 n=1 Tax=Cryptomeria japonica TaxID=3369 RepID=UPI0027DA74A6
MARCFFLRKTASEVENRISNLAIHNRSSRRLSFDERKLLGLGIKFIPRPPPMSVPDLHKEFRAFARLLRLRAFFGPDNQPSSFSPLASGVFPHRFRQKNPFWHPDEPNFQLEEIIRSAESIFQTRVASCSFSRRPPLPVRLLKSLKDLRNDPSIVIKPADKNLGLVVLDTSWYKCEGLRQLSDPLVYLRVDCVPWKLIWSRLTFIIEKNISFLKPVSSFLLKNPASSARACAFYLLPKLHKPVLVGRPICSYTGYMLEPASKFLHLLLFPILLQQQSHLPDSLSLLRDLDRKPFPPGCILFTFDVESLYPSIPTTDGLIALREMVTEYFQVQNFNLGLVDLIMELAELVLREHYIEFDGIFYKQLRGTAMGSNFAVVYACLFLCHLEKRLFSQYDCSSLAFFKRFIDDALGVWTGDESSLLDFFSQYQSFYPEIKITPSVSSSSVDLLDITFFKGVRFSACGVLDTKCYQKPLNAYQYIPYYSWHPPHQKKSFILSELKRYLLRESDPFSFMRLRKQFYSRLRARGYPKKFLLSCFRL